jgi:hypothetical protein
MDDDRFPRSEAGASAIGSVLGAAGFLWMWWTTGIILFATADMSVALGLLAAAVFFVRQWHGPRHPRSPGPSGPRST